LACALAALSSSSINVAARSFTDVRDQIRIGLIDDRAECEEITSLLRSSRPLAIDGEEFNPALSPNTVMVIV